MEKQNQIQMLTEYTLLLEEFKYLYYNSQLSVEQQLKINKLIAHTYERIRTYKKLLGLWLPQDEYIKQQNKKQLGN